MWPLIGFADYIGITLLDDHIIAIYRDFSLSAMALFNRHHVDCYKLNFFVISPHGWVQPLVWIATYIGINFLSDCIIAIYRHCFYPSTIASFHRHRCWLLYLEVFIWFLPMDDCNHLLGLMITLEVLYWVIILSLYWYYDRWLHLKYFDEQSYSNFILFITNHQNRKKWQVINLHWIKNIKARCDWFISGSIPPCTL